MRPLRTRLQEARRSHGLPWHVIERDYLLSWIIAGIEQVPALSETLVFKGGTALRKCYFGNYRFSEDLDFTGLEGAPTGEDMGFLIQEACVATERLLDEYAPVEIVCERYTERDPHPGDQEAFTIRARMPWQSRPQTRIMIEVTVDEKVLRPAVRRKLIHAYDESLDVDIRVYSLEEMLSEKLRAILQHAEMFERRGWSRSRARDYYDMWRVLDTYKDELDLVDFDSLLRDKCVIRHVEFEGHDDFFPGRMLSYVERTWEQWLDPLVPHLPSFETVIEELRPRVAELLS